MFHCALGNHQTKPHQPRVLVVVKRYPDDAEGNLRGQIAREVSSCVSCATAVQNNLLEIPARLKE